MYFVRSVGVLLAGALLYCGGGAALAQKSPADTIKARQDAMKSMGSNLKAINEQLKGATPDAAAIKTAVAGISTTGKDIAAWFPAGTGPDSGVKTRAKAEIWSDAAGFKAAADSFVAGNAKFMPIAAAGNIDTIKADLKAFTDGCGGCHMKFRAPEEKK
ncbi:MAG: cytochrome c [Rhodospirillaceae bacterium]|nr:cytochrome c [Rhodospirillaceae bacterium]